MLNNEMQNVEVEKMEAVEMVTCYECGELHPIDECHELWNGDFICDSCAEAIGYSECAGCGKWDKNENFQEGADGEWYCDDCFDENFVKCEHCGDVIYRDDAYTVHTDAYPSADSPEFWCRDCLDEAYYCDDCEEYFKYGEDVESDGNTTVCNRCFSNDYVRCEECGRIIPYDDAYDNGDACYCDDCYDDGGNVIHCYHSHIRPFHWHGIDDESERRSTLCVGVELELDRQEHSHHRNSDAYDIIDAAGCGVDEDFVVEDDGSLQNGFEIISSTATVDYHINEYGWDDLMEEARRLGYVSHDMGTCGLHVHIDRTYFADSMANPEHNALIILVNNEEWLKKFSRRQNFGYCKFPSDRFNMHFNASDFKPHDCASDTRNVYEDLDKLTSWARGHYVALNLANEATIEVRFNRGTLNFETFKATLQFVQLYADAIKHSRLDTACKVNLEWFVRVAKRRNYTEFLDYLKRRNIL